MLYQLLKAIISFGIRLYYKEIKIENKHYLDDQSPSILIGNHPNTLMDPWIIGYANSSKIYFMAKATFFSSRLKRRFLRGLGMIPINRKNDGAVQGVSNKDSFEACYTLLEKGGRLVIFPEGTSYMERQLRELKTGTARIGLEMEKRTKGKIPLKVIPIGLNYIAGESFRGRVRVQIGKPIELNDYWEAYEKDPGKTAKEVTELFRVALTRVFVNMEDSENEKLVDQLATLFDTRYSNQRQDVAESIDFLKEARNRLDELQLTQPWKLAEIKTKTTNLKNILESKGLQVDFFDRPFRKNMFARQNIQSVLFLITSVPFFIIGFFHHALPYWLIGRLLPKITKEVEYHAPLTVLLGLILYPLYYFLSIYILSHLLVLTWWQWSLYCISLPFFGIFTHFCLRYFVHVRAKGKFIQFAGNNKVDYESLKKEREELRQLIFN
jgi:1-acyl-sn-glycerol-3-phosphate acyltransferase